MTLHRDAPGETDLVPGRLKIGDFALQIFRIKVAFASD
jgi:hypothetical protein